MPFPVRMAILPKSGVCKCRNFGIDNATGEYVMLCDCDDRFCNLYGLRMLWSKMNDGYDAITSVFIEEHNRNGIFEIISRDKDGTFIHGKAYRKAYLDEQKIRFDESLVVNEDGYFTCLATQLAEKKAEIGTPFYTWVWRDGSVSDKNDPSWVLKRYRDLIKMRNHLCREMKRRGKNDIYRDFVVKTICDTYFDTFSSIWLDPNNAEHVKEAERCFKTFYTTYREVYRSTPISRIAEIYTIARMSAWSRGQFIETRTLKEFLTYILNKVQ